MSSPTVFNGVDVLERMANGDPYRNNARQYDEWFDANRFVYDAELRAVRSLFVPGGHRALEVGVGTGRFAAPLGITLGIDPSPEMGRIARARGVAVAVGIAEDLPFRDSAAKCILMVTTVCFIADVLRGFQECFRVLEKGGVIVVGMLDRASPVGRTYSEEKQRSLFYRRARFYSVGEVLDMLGRAGFRGFDFRQTLFGQVSNIGPNEAVRTGHGEGLFAVVRAGKD